MENAKLEVDSYTRFILTIIAITLVGLLFKGFLTAKIASAQKETIDVNITQISGQKINSILCSPVSVKIVE